MASRESAEASGQGRVDAELQSSVSSSGAFAWLILRGLRGGVLPALTWLILPLLGLLHLEAIWSQRPPPKTPLEIIIWKWSPRSHFGALRPTLTGKNDRN